MKLFVQPLLASLASLYFVEGTLSCPTFTDVSLERVVAKEGYHRELTTSLRGNVTGLGPAGLSFVIVETFPAGFYVDQYEIANLRSFGGPEVLISEDIDVEKPAHLSQEFTFLIFAEPDTVDDGRFNVSITLPIHLRYQRPQIDGDHHMSELPNPALAVKCEEQFSSSAERDNFLQAPCAFTTAPTLCDWKKVEPQVSSEPLEMSVPIGQKNHVAVVACVTIFAVSTLTFLLLYTTFTSTAFVSRK